MDANNPATGSLLQRKQEITAQQRELDLELRKIKRELRVSPKEHVRQWRAAKRAIPPTLEQLRDVLSYDPDSGVFRWRVRRHGYGGYVEIGDVAGTLKPGKGGGYILIVVDQQNYRAHRLAWWFMTGKPAPQRIDVEHENRDRADNRWKNLRLATRSQNNANTGLRCTNTTGVKGVHRVSSGYGKPWFARITVHGKRLHLGCFDTIEEAAAARRKAEIQYQGVFRSKG